MTSPTRRTRRANEGEDLPIRQHVTTTSTVTNKDPNSGEWVEVSRKVDVTVLRGEFPEEAAAREQQ